MSPRRKSWKKGDAIVLTRLSERLAASQHVNRAVILALDGVVNAQGEPRPRPDGNLHTQNEFLAAEIPQYPNLLWGASASTPTGTMRSPAFKWARAHCAVLIKCLPSVHHIDPADPRNIPFYRKIVELGLPQLAQTVNERSITQARDEFHSRSLTGCVCRCNRA